MKPKAPHALCHKCPFKDRAFVKSAGDPKSKLAIVSRSPGKNEVLNGKPFTGPSGKVLDHLLGLQGLQRKDVFTTNVVLCESDGDDEGFGVAQACCAPRLEAEIAEADSVIAAGSEAVRGVLSPVGGIYSNRGFAHEREVKRNGGMAKQRVIVTNNPVMVIRDDATFPELVRDFRLAINPLPQPKLPKVRWTEDVEEARDWIGTLRDALVPDTLVAVDIEGGYPDLASISFAVRPERAIVFGRPVVEGILKEIKPLLELEEVRYVGQFFKYDVKALRRFGINARVDEDTGLLSYALDERPGNPESGAGGHALEWLLKDELGWPRYEPTSVRYFKSRKQEWEDWPNKDWNAIPKRSRIDLYEYNGMDAAGTLALHTVLTQRAKLDSVYEKPYKRYLLPLTNALAEVELYGNIYDAEAACDILESEVWPKLDEWKQVMRTISKTPELNPNSPKQLVELMYDTWGISHNLDRPKIERKGKRSTDQLVREVLLRGEYTCTNEQNRPGIDAFIQTLDLWKELDTQRSRYLEGLILKRSDDGRIYTHYKEHGTESGRLSGSDPNMQNITRPKEGLPNIRRVFRADPGCQFISADLSQAELRTIAKLSGDQNLQAIYLDTDRSLHKEVATEFYGEGYSYEQYVRAKNINFGVAYWQSAYSFAQLYHMPQAEAQKFIDFWWERFPRVWEWTKEMERQVLDEGVIQSPFGHKRRFYVIPSDQSARLHIVKEGINFLPQNIAANITLYALTKLVHELDPKSAEVRITVHDSIVVNARDSIIEETAALMKELMESAAKDSIGWDFPYKADISIGPTWGDLKEQDG
jgi:DNA polymerase-1